MMGSRVNPIRWLFDSRCGLAERGPQRQVFVAGARDRLIPRWIFLRALALIYFSAFYSLLKQIKGLIGPRGILPASDYLTAVAQQLGWSRYWFTPSLYWISSSNAALMTVTWVGLIASVIAFFNLWPRLSFFLCWVCFLSFVAASSTFSSYQSDGMLLEAGFIALFFAPPGLLPGWGAAHPPSRASLWLLQWEWFRIYFESGMVKLASGDPQWRNFTAMDQYYQNGPLPTWIGWYAEHLPHWFAACSVGATLALELGSSSCSFSRAACASSASSSSRRGRSASSSPPITRSLITWCSRSAFCCSTTGFCAVLFPRVSAPPELLPAIEPVEELPLSILAAGDADVDDRRFGLARRIAQVAGCGRARSGRRKKIGLAVRCAACGLILSAILLTWIAYDTTVEMIAIPLGQVPGPALPVSLLDPFRIANQYGLFAVMTRGRYEIEFQGSNDGQNWIAYPFRNKPQALNQAPGIYAPYQPRFDWNLWFASLGDWRQNDIVPLTEERLLENDPDVLALFKGNPFPDAPPRYVRAVLWQYWFTTEAEKQKTGNWWTREYMGLYAPELTRGADGKFEAVEMPGELPPHD